MAIGNRACIVDVYAGDGWVEPAILKANGADAICIKAGQAGWQDPRFAENWAKAKGVLPRQAYWFLDPRDTLGNHINGIRKALGADPGEMPLLQDYEANKALGINLAPLSWLRQIDDAMLTTYRRPTMIYTNQNFWQMGGGLTYTWGATRDLFTAQYPWIPDPANGQPRIYAPWKTWRAWQYTDHGTMLGAQSKSRDLSVFNGTVAQMMDWIASFNVVIPPPAEPSDAVKLAKLWAAHPEIH